MAIPIFISHSGAQPHVLDCLRQTATHNREIFFIGDDSNRSFAHLIPGLRWIDRRSIELSPKTLEILRRFTNYSTNSREFELFCISRMFYAQALLDILSCDSCFHLDSDCALLTDINSVRFSSHIALSVYSEFGNSLRMAASVHNALITQAYLRRFTELAEEIYVQGTGFGLIADKIRFHQQNQIEGGVCDMTLHCILSKEMSVQNLGAAFDGQVFDYRFGSGEGNELQSQYAMDSGHKVLRRENGDVYIRDLRGPWIKLLSIHFQGDSKKFVTILDRICG